MEGYLRRGKGLRKDEDDVYGSGFRNFCSNWLPVALAATITGLFSQTEKVLELAGLVEPQLRLLADRWEA